MIRRAGILAAIVFATTVLSAAITRFDGTLYTVTDSTITVRWSPPATGSPPTRYDVRVRMTNPSALYPVVDVGLNTQATVARPRAGHFIVEVRAVNSAGPGPWLQSSNSQYSTVNGNPSGWMIYWRLPAPGGVGVD